MVSIFSKCGPGQLYNSACFLTAKGRLCGWIGYRAELILQFFIMRCEQWGGGGIVLHISVGHSPTPICIVEFPHVVDTGGQPEFIETMPSQIHNSNLTLLVLNHNCLTI